MADPLDALCINTIRTLSIDAVQKAKSGHPGLPLGAAPMGYVLWQNHLKHNPKDPSWADRDRFVLSAGHGSMLIYSLLHLTGYDLSLDEIKRFRQLGSKTAGHPEYGLCPGVECTTGPLGQGSVNAVGMAMAERALASHFNRPGHEIVDHFTYALVSDGDIMEGINAEAASLAGHLKLGKLVYLYDANDISLDGPTDLAFTEDTGKRYEAYGWHVQTVAEGDTDLAGIDAAITAAKQETSKPSLIIVKTTIGFGSPNKAGTSSSHGSPLGADEVKLTKKALGWDPDAQFLIPEEAGAHFSRAVDRGGEAQNSWQGRFDAYAEAHPDLAEQWRLAWSKGLPTGWDGDVPTFEPGSKAATRSSGGQVMNAIAGNVPWLLGGDADLSCSTKTALSGTGSFDGQTGDGRNVHFGVREHAMGAIANGMSYHGGVRPYTATFFCFADYMRPAIRLAALNHLNPIFVFTHDSIGLGEDGPTHQPVEHLMSLRCMPNLLVLRPADSNEVGEAWKVAMEQTERPVALVFSRQNLPAVDRSTHGDAKGLRRGGYVVSEAGGDEKAVLIATGSEVCIALEAQAILKNDGLAARVVSMPSWELFDAQDQGYRDQVLPPQLEARVAIEAGVRMGWERYIGPKGDMVSVDRFGTSAPGPEIYEEYGLTAAALAAKVKALV